MLTLVKNVRIIRKFDSNKDVLASSSLDVGCISFQDLRCSFPLLMLHYLRQEQGRVALPGTVALTVALPPALSLSLQPVGSSQLKSTGILIYLIKISVPGHESN